MVDLAGVVGHCGSSRLHNSTTDFVAVPCRAEFKLSYQIGAPSEEYPALTPDTTVFQEMADAMLPLFDNMPQVVVLVQDHEAFQREPFPAAIYAWPNIVINPSHARTCSYEEMQDTICHELIHAWMHWKGVATGEFLDTHHDEWFVKKALEINQKKIDSLNVDVDYLLTTTKGVNIYNRVAGIQFAPHLRHKIRRIRRTIAAYAKLSFQLSELSKQDSFSRLAIIALVVSLTSLILYKAHLISDTVASFVWSGSAIACLVIYTLILIFQRTR